MESQPVPAAVKADRSTNEDRRYDLHEIVRLLGYVLQSRLAVFRPPMPDGRRSKTAGGLFLLGGLLLIVLLVVSVSGLLFLLLADDQSHDAQLGQTERAGAVGPAFVGLHLRNAFITRHYTSKTGQTPLPLQTLVDGHSKSLPPSRRSKMSMSLQMLGYPP